MRASFLTIKWVSESCDCAFRSRQKPLRVLCFHRRAFTSAEASSDARFMHDMLRKMLHAPVFLDSSSLADLRKLITEGVHKSETVLLLATKGVLSRPCAAGI